MDTNFKELESKEEVINQEELADLIYSQLNKTDLKIFAYIDMFYQNIFEDDYCEHTFSDVEMSYALGIKKDTIDKSINKMQGIRLRVKTMEYYYCDPILWVKNSEINFNGKTIRKYTIARNKLFKFFRLEECVDLKLDKEGLDNQFRALGLI